MKTLLLLICIIAFVYPTKELTNLLGISKDYLQNDTFQTYYRHFNTTHFIPKTLHNNIYIPIIRDKIKAYGIPDMLLYIPLIESAYNINAKSHKNAMGLWQLMPSTALDYGLTINHLVDDRKDILKSTDIAITHIKRLYERFGKWYLVILAYNCGEGCLSKQINAIQSDDISDLMHSGLPQETKTYFNRFLAIILSNNSLKTINNKATTLLSITAKDTHLFDISVQYGVDYNQLLALNPQFLYHTVPHDRDYLIYLPMIRLY